MITAHGSNELNPLFVSDAKQRMDLLESSKSMKTVLISSAAVANAVMLGGGYFTPLNGYMNQADALSVADTMQTTNGLFWPVPILNLVPQAADIKVGDSLACLDSNINGHPTIAIMQVEEVEKYPSKTLNHIAQKTFGTVDPKHPGVANFLAQGNIGLAGPIQVLNYSYFASTFPSTFKTAVAIRKDIAERGWKKIVAFQTRNPMHLAHETLCRIAMERLDCDGLVIHMLLGKLKAGDIPANVRDAAIRKMIDIYFPPNTALVTGYGFDMLYAGPREALLHALFRQNMGATHFIIGRDHAGVGDYYSAFESQEIFDTIPKDALQIKIFRADHTAWSKKLNQVVMMCEAPDHQPDDFVLLSGTKVREMLTNGQPLPKEFSRPEVASILMEYYQSRKD